MKTLSLILTAGLVSLTSFHSESAAPPVPPETKVLEQFVGTWETESTAKVAEWTPKEVKATGSIKCAWALGGRFVQGKGTDSQSGEVQSHWTYDANKKTYRMWFFNSDGVVVQWIGQWKPESKSFLLKQYLGNGIMDTLTARMADANTIEFTSEAKGKDGKIYFAFEGRWTRRK